MSRPDTEPMRADIDDGAVLDWTALKALMDANAASQRALEDYLYRAHHEHTNGSGDATEFIERSIRKHEMIIEHLQLAIDAAERCDARPAEEEV
jgi:hypothetical protein